MNQGQKNTVVRKWTPSIESSDAIVICCSYDLRVCDHACQLIKDGYSERLVISGMQGNWTRHLWDSTEAEVFFPTDTSTLLIEGASSILTGPKKLLDLGCGSGVVGVTLAKLGLASPPLYASDLSPQAADLTRRNAEKAGIMRLQRRAPVGPAKVVPVGPAKVAPVGPAKVGPAKVARAAPA